MLIAYSLNDNFIIFGFPVVPELAIITCPSDILSYSYIVYCERLVLFKYNILIFDIVIFSVVINILLFASCIFLYNTSIPKLGSSC